MIGRRELLDHRSFGKCYIIFIVETILLGFSAVVFLIIGTRKTLHFLTINNDVPPRSMAAMLGIDLCEAEILRNRLIYVPLFFNLQQIVHFLTGKCYTLLFIVFFVGSRCEQSAGV